MARRQMVTRTLTSTKANIMCLDIQAGEPFNTVVTLNRTYKDEDAILKAAKPKIETANIKAVHVVDTEVVETLYGMSEEMFIQYAEVLPPRSNSAGSSDGTCVL